MKNPVILTFLLIAFLTAFTSVAAAQDNPPPPPEGERMGPPPQGPGMQPPPDDRGEILRQLNLTQEQFRAIRKLLGENQPKVRDAQIDFREAQEALDEAIYADTVDETLVQNLTRRSAEAQATLMKLRTASEFAIRRVLTPEQVTKFRELRKEQILRKRMQERLRQQQQRPNNGQGPLGPPLGQPGRPQGQPPGQPAGQPVRQPGNNVSGPKRKPAF